MPSDARRSRSAGSAARADSTVDAAGSESTSCVESPHADRPHAAPRRRAPPRRVPGRPRSDAPSARRRRRLVLVPGGACRCTRRSHRRRLRRGGCARPRAPRGRAAHVLVASDRRGPPRRARRPPRARRPRRARAPRARRRPAPRGVRQARDGPPGPLAPHGASGRPPRVGGRTLVRAYARRAARRDVLEPLPRQERRAPRLLPRPGLGPEPHRVDGRRRELRVARARARGRGSTLRSLPGGRRGSGPPDRHRATPARLRQRSLPRRRRRARRARVGRRAPGPRG